MTRQPVKVTYAHKRGRANAAAKLLSSPLEALPPDRDDITRSEMSRRMLKRSRGVANEDDDTVRLKGHIVKRARKTVVSDAPGAEADVDAFQTPFPSADYASAGTRKVFPRTECQKYSLAHELAKIEGEYRPSSPHTGSTTKAKARSSRVPLHLKSRTLSGAFQKDDSAYTRRKISHKDSTISLNDRKLSRKDSTISLNYTRLSRKNSTVSLNELARYSPSKHQRRPSSPDPSYMLSHIAQQDWISPSKALTIHAGVCEPDRNSITQPNPIQSLSASPFLIDRPQFFSTPPHSRSGSRTGLQAPKSPSNLAFLAPSPRLPRDEDFEMADHTKHRKIRISGNSIISSSGSFTLRSHQISNAIDFDDRIDSAGSAPMSMSIDILPQKISMGEYMITLASSPPALDANLGPQHKVSLGQNILALPGSSPPDGSSSPALDCPGSSARNVSANLPPRGAATLGIGAPSEADLIQDMLSLDLGDRHDDSTQLPMRTRSLETPASVSSKKTSTVKHKRNRAGTIRASDFTQTASSCSSGSTLTSLASTIAGPAGSLPGRTRSGTVVGPNSKLAIRPHAKGAMRKQSLMQLTLHDAHSRSGDDMDIFRVHEDVGSCGTEELGSVGLMQRLKGRRGKKKLVHDEIVSDDPLLITGITSKVVRSVIVRLVGHKQVIKVRLHHTHKTLDEIER
ncbi:uncharacterized protein HD556DRAFT_1536617 [Suillus plorans]|uniref:Uncharacterized protein n=1 Tax=Suillus plorans TaxID=116603 RepID=A0A9P7AQ94_9AGAM|nr:uncharacterized protein HD556DRAFT_1536617 [Suillus plorans]KAG1793134.1 hypothetical protein HD556DRAFT_1536617 [Suillus plorans]